MRTEQEIWSETKKKRYTLHDDTITSRVHLTLWNNHIQNVSKDGSHKFQELRVKNYNGKYLTTTKFAECQAELFLPAARTFFNN